MTTKVLQQPEGRVRQVGKVVTQVTITNEAHEIRAEDGTIQPSQVRSIGLPDVLVDTGATTLCLPVNLVQQLGLRHLKNVMASTATSTEVLGIYGGAKVSLHGRSATVQCMALPTGSPPLIGVIPLEMLGMEPDLQNQRLRLLPETGRDTHYLAPSPITY